MNRMRRRLAIRLRWSTGVATALLSLLPRLALACPTCYASAGERVVTSYLQSAAILTLLPFAIAGVGAAIALHLRRQARLIESSALDPTA